MRTSPNFFPVVLKLRHKLQDVYSRSLLHEANSTTTTLLFHNDEVLVR